MSEKKKKDNFIVINKKAAVGIVAAMPTIGILISRHSIGPLILFMLGIGIGIFIGINLKAEQSKKQ